MVLKEEQINVSNFQILTKAPHSKHFDETEKTFYQSGGNFLLSEVKVLQGDKVMFDQKFWLQTTILLLCQNLKLFGNLKNEK